MVVGAVVNVVVAALTGIVGALVLVEVRPVVVVAPVVGAAAGEACAVDAARSFDEHAAAMNVVLIRIAVRTRRRPALATGGRRSIAQASRTRL